MTLLKSYAFMQCNGHLKIFQETIKCMVTNLYKDDTTLFMTYGTIYSQIFKGIQGSSIDPESFYVRLGTRV